MNIKHPIRIDTAEFNQNVHRTFAWMREHAPVYETRFTRRMPAYLITRYDDVTAVLKDPRIRKNPDVSKQSSGSSFWVPPVFRPLLNNMLNTDEPDHRRLRNLVHKAFTPRMVSGLEPRIEEIAHDLLDRASKKRHIDLIADFALPLPVTVIAEMIGIPEHERYRFSVWSNRIAVNPTPLNMLKAIPAVYGFMRYTRRLAEQRRRDPKDDLLTALAQAEHEGERLTEDELLGMVFLLVIAGHETTVNLIGNGTKALLSHPDQLARLKGDFGLMDTAVEEMLRFDGPLNHTEMCFAAEPVELHDVPISRGALVLPCIQAANRDPAVFDRPDCFDIGRFPNRHLAFGHGIHYCLGAPLARLETKIAFCTLLHRFPDLKLAVPPDALHYQGISMLHRLKQLPVVLQ